MSVVGRRPERDRRRGRDRHRRLRPSGRQAALGRLHDEADDRAPHARGGEARRHVHGRRLQRAAGRVQDRAAGGRADARVGPDARPAAGIRQRRRGHAGRGRLRLAQGVRAPDEPARARAQAREHALREPDRARPGGQLLVRARPRDAGDPAAQEPVLQQGRGLPVRDAQDRRPAAHVPQPQPARDPLRLGQRRQDRPHPRRGLRARRLGAPERGPARQRGARDAQRGGPRQRHDEPVLVGLPALPAGPRRRPGPADGEGADPLPRRCRTDARPGPHRAPDRPARAPRRDHDGRPRTGGRRGADRARPAARARRGQAGRKGRRHRAAGRRQLGARGGSRAEDEVGRRAPVGPVARRDRRPGRYGPARTPPLLHRAAALGRHAPHDRHRHAQHGHRQDAVGAQLPARPPPPDRRADDDAGRQGRQRRARAQDARRARDRDRARGRRHRHPDRRPAHAALAC